MNNQENQMILAEEIIRILGNGEIYQERKQSLRIKSIYQDREIFVLIGRNYIACCSPNSRGFINSAIESVIDFSDPRCMDEQFMLEWINKYTDV